MIKNLLLKLKNKQAAKRVRPTSTVAYSSAKTVGLLLDEYAYKNIHKNITESFEKDGKSTTTVVLRKLDETAKPLGPDCIEVNEKQVSATGKISNESLERFIHTDFDFLCVISDESTLLLENILAFSEAKCKIGQHKEETLNYCDLMVTGTPDESILTITQRMLHYIKSIR